MLRMAKNKGNFGFSLIMPTEDYRENRFYSADLELLMDKKRTV